MNKRVYKRLLWADAIRILAIYLVVQIHTMNISVAKTSIPLFFMVSGALLLGKKEKYTIFFKKRVLKVLIPWIFWTLIYMVYYLYFSNVNDITIKDYFSDNISNTTLLQWLHYFIRMFFSALWFLPVIFGLYLLTPILRIVIRHSKKFEKYYMLIIWFLFFSLFPYTFGTSFFPTYEPNLFFTVFQYSGYFLLGYILIKQKLSSKAIACLVLLFITSAFFMNKSQSGFLNPFIIICSVSLFCLLYFLFTHIEKYINNMTKKTISLISGASFGIYLIHEIVLGFWRISIFNFLNSYRIDFFFTLIIFTLSLIIILILKKIPLLKYLVP
jgi:surface polysaccharide O-acyltransferase-like enzyme